MTDTTKVHNHYRSATVVEVGTDKPGRPQRETAVSLARCPRNQPVGIGERRGSGADCTPAGPLRTPVPSLRCQLSILAVETASASVGRWWRRHLQVRLPGRNSSIAGDDQPRVRVGQRLGWQPTLFRAQSGDRRSKRDEEANGRLESSSAASPRR